MFSHITPRTGENIEKHTPATKLPFFNWHRDAGVLMEELKTLLQGNHISCRSDGLDLVVTADNINSSNRQECIEKLETMSIVAKPEGSASLRIPATKSFLDFLKDFHNKPAPTNIPTA